MKSFPGNILILLITAIFLSAGLPDAYGQMFSVREPEESVRGNIPGNNISIGIEPVTFVYKGDESALNAGVYEFSDPIIRIMYENPFLDLYLGFGGGITGIDEISYFDAGLRFAQGLNVVRNNKINVQVPLQLKTSITNVSSEQAISAVQQFEQGTFSFGGGIFTHIRFNNTIRFSARVVPNIGFTFSTGGTFGGSIFDFESGANLFFDRLFGNIGLSAGWDFNLRQYRVDEEQFDYNLDANTISLGITF